MNDKLNGMITGRYMNLLVDYAFKKVFGENKKLLIDFLNTVIRKDNPIKEIEYLPTEQMTRRKTARRAIFDIYCKDESGEEFIIELQIAPQKFFMDRLLYYASHLIRKQAKRGNWDFELKPLYCIAILNFNVFPDERYISHISLIREETNEKVSEKLNLILIELKKFDKQAENLTTPLEKWLFCFKNIGRLENKPEEITGEVFETLFETTEFDKLNDEDMKQYSNSVLNDWDVRLALDYQRELGEKDGMQQGVQQGKLARTIEIIREGLKQGLSLDVLAKLTNYPKEKIIRLQQQNLHNRQT